MVSETLVFRVSGPRYRGEASRLCRRSRDHVSGDHTDLGTGSVAGMGAVTDPDRCGTLARSGGRSAGAAVSRDAIGGRAPIRERPIIAPRMTRVTSSQGGQYGCLTD